MSEFNFRRVWGPPIRYPTVLSIKPKQHDLIAIAGPCSIEGMDKTITIAKELKRVGVTYMRGGVFRAGTYPPKEYGINIERLRDMAFAAKKTGLKTIVEVVDMRELEILDRFVDAFQVGARQMQNYGLLDELSQQSKPVTLKRNMGATLDEFLGAAEYLVRNGKRNVILIERGSSTHMNHVRWDLSISTIAMIKRMTGLSIIVDASHGTGRRDLVEPMTLAGIAAGADGFLVEVHPEPEKSSSDSDQAFPLDQYETLVNRVRNIRLVLDGKMMLDKYVWQTQYEPIAQGV